MNKAERVRRVLTEARGWSAPRWGVDLKAINKWIKDHVPFRAVASKESTVLWVVVSTDVANDLLPYAKPLEKAFPGVQVSQPGMKNYLRMVFPSPHKKLGEA